MTKGSLAVSDKSRVVHPDFVMFLFLMLSVLILFHCLSMCLVKDDKFIYLDFDMFHQSVPVLEMVHFQLLNQW